jgi:predicted DCC family thiol-disulfide oxidoreductase YuxK
MFYDGSCPLCAREVAVYQELSETQGSRVKFHNLADEGVGELGKFGITLGEVSAQWT